MAQQYSGIEDFNFKKVFPVLAGIVLFILVIVFWKNITVTIPAGHGGVLFRQLSGGLDKENPYGEGFHFIAPWNRMYVYDIRQHEVSETMNILSSNGLEITVDVSVWYKPLFSEIGYLHGNIGIDYQDKVVIPSIRSSARSVIGRYAPEQIYSTKRDSIQHGIFVEIRSLLDKKHVDIKQVLIRSIILPPTIKTAIESKLKQEQESLEYEFKLEKAQKEAERQKIEAEGKATANRIVSASLTDKILQEKGIDATLNLSNSSNTKVVVIGNSKNGLPLILGDSK